MEQWLKGYGIPAVVLVALVLAVRYGPRLWKVLVAFRAAERKIHETEREIAEVMERKASLVSGEHTNTLKKLAAVEADVLELTRRLEIKDDLNRQDRIAQQIYRKYLRECGCDLAEVDRQIRKAVEVFIYERSVED
jgi:hypothetical protein